MSRPAFPEDLVTATQFASLCRVSPSGLSNWQKRGAARGRPPLPDPWGVFGATTLFHRDDVDAFVAELETGQAETAEQLRSRARALLDRADRLEER